MSTETGTLDSRPFEQADETRTPKDATIDIVTIGGHSIGRFTFQPGWSWSESVKPAAGTDHCMKEHIGYVVSGELDVWLTDGTRKTLKAGDAYVIPPGHDATNSGSVPYVGVEFASADTYAKR